MLIYTGFKYTFSAFVVVLDIFVEFYDAMRRNVSIR